MAIQWSETYSVGVVKIDEQHKELFNRTNQLLNACNLGKGKEEINKLLDFLQEYVVIHFRDEEALQSKYNYPDYKEHKQLHDHFIGEVKKLKDKFEKEGSTLSLVVEINQRLIEWLINHIGKMDKQVGAHLKGKM